MLYFTFTVAYLSLVGGRTFRPRLPGGLSHSIVNLGKMDFNVYLNSKPESFKNDFGMAPPKPHILKSEPTGCPCQQNHKTQEEDAADFIVDLFSGVGPSRFKETKNSILCCSSEETQEELILEIKPRELPFPPMRQGFPPIPQQILPKSPRFPTIKFPSIPAHFPPISHNVPPMTIFPFGEMFPKNMQLTGAGTVFLDELIPGKGRMPEFKKIIEISVDPTKKAKTPRPPTTMAAIKPDIKAMGEKKTTMLYDLMSTNLSVKKDLTQDIGGPFKDVETILIPSPTGTFNHNNTL